MKLIQHTGLREHGVYSFPDGTQVVSRAREAGGSVLYYLADWELFGSFEVEAERNAPAFRIVEANSMGQIFRFGLPTQWYLDDLTDTGHTAKQNTREKSFSAAAR